MFDGLIPIVLAFFIVTVSPGPANIATATVAMRYGRSEGLLFGAGLSLGLAFWGLIAASGLGAVLQTSAHLLTIMKVLGGLYLLWLAFQSGRDALRGSEAKAASVKQGRWFLRGLLLNLSNPKAVVAWMAALSMGMAADSGGEQVVLATTICAALGLLNYTSYALAFSMPHFMAGYRRFQRRVEGMVAGLFALAGLSLIRSAFSR